MNFGREKKGIKRKISVVYFCTSLSGRLVSSSSCPSIGASSFYNQRYWTWRKWTHSKGTSWPCFQTDCGTTSTAYQICYYQLLYTASSTCWNSTAYRNGSIPSTSSKTFAQEGYHRRVACQKPFLSAINKEKHLQFAVNYLNWTVQDWARVLWTDESPFNIVGAHGTIWVTRKPGEEYIEECLVPKFRKVSCFSPNNYYNSEPIKIIIRWLTIWL